MPSTADRFRTAVEKGDHAALADLFSEDIRFYSPVKFAPFEGRPLVLGLFGVLLRTFEDFRYLGEFEGTTETTGGGPAGHAVVLPFRTTVDGRQIHGIDQLQFDADGRINEFTVMVRPLTAVQSLSAAVLRGLVAEGLVPAPADS